MQELEPLAIRVQDPHKFYCGFDPWIKLRFHREKNLHKPGIMPYNDASQMSEAPSFPKYISNRAPPKSITRFLLEIAKPTPMH
jgi:hypothetical protein